MSSFAWDTMFSDEQARQEAMPGGYNVIGETSFDNYARGGITTYRVIRWVDGLAEPVAGPYETRIEGQRVIDAILALRGE